MNRRPTMAMGRVGSIPGTVSLCVVRCAAQKRRTLTASRQGPVWLPPRQRTRTGRKGKGPEPASATARAAETPANMPAPAAELPDAKAPSARVRWVSASALGDVTPTVADSEPPTCTAVHPSTTCWAIFTCSLCSTNVPLGSQFQVRHATLRRHSVRPSQNVYRGVDVSQSGCLDEIHVVEGWSRRSIAVWDMHSAP